MIGLAFIRTAKDLRRLTPKSARVSVWVQLPVPLHPGRRWAMQITPDYQRALAYRGAVDFDDLIRLALAALQSDHGLLEPPAPALALHPGRRSPGFSSRLQEQILALHCRARMATGCGSAIPTRPSTRPSPPPTRVSARFHRQPEVQRAAAQFRALNH